VTSFLPFHFSGSIAIAILAAVGLLVGLSCFLRGFFQLHRKPVASRVQSSANAMETARTATTSADDSSKSPPPDRDVHGEVIRLSPAGDAILPAAAMTQQGKIAAALLKAGVPSPATWSASTDPAAVALKMSGPEVLDSRSLDSKVLMPASADPSLSIRSHQSAAPPSGNPALMLWGGAALALASIYALAAHFGLL
jgi:hypothetical protein